MRHAQPRHLLLEIRDVDAFLVSLGRKGVSTATVAKYRQSLQRVCAFARKNGVRNIRYASSELFLEYRQARTKQTISRSAIARDESHILAFYTWIFS